MRLAGAGDVDVWTLRGFLESLARFGFFRPSPSEESDSSEGVATRCIRRCAGWFKMLSRLRGNVRTLPARLPIWPSTTYSSLLGSLSCSDSTAGGGGGVATDCSSSTDRVDLNSSALVASVASSTCSTASWPSQSPVNTGGQYRSFGFINRY